MRDIILACKTWLTAASVRSTHRHFWCHSSVRASSNLVTLCLTSIVHSVITLLTVTPSSARREQTFKKPSQDLVFGIFPGASSLITSAIRHHLWLLLTSALTFASDQIHCLATKPTANSSNVQTYLSNWCTGPERQFACHLRRSFRVISEVCLSSSCKCIQHLKESCSHNVSWDKHGWLHALVHSMEAQPTLWGQI